MRYARVRSVEGVADRQDAGDPDAGVCPNREQRRGLHLHRQCPFGAPARVARQVALIEEVGADDPALAVCALAPAAGLPRKGTGQGRIGACQLLGAQGDARPIGGDRLAGDDEVAKAERRVKRSAGAHPDRACHAEADQLVQHDRGATARPCRCSGS